MAWRARALALVMGWGAFPGLAWGGKVRLGRKYRVGEKTVYRSRLHTRVSVQSQPVGLESFLPPIPKDFDLQQENTVTVRAIRADGSAEVETRFDRFQIRSDLAESFPEELRDSAQRAQEDFARRMTGRTLVVRYDREGRLLNFEGADEILNQVESPWQEPLRQALKLFLEQTSGNARYPEERVAPGQEWRRPLNTEPATDHPFLVKGENVLSYAGKTRYGGVKAAIIAFRLREVLTPVYDPQHQSGPMAELEARDMHLEMHTEVQGEGRVGTDPPVEGQEGCQVGSVLALREGDWIVPSFRESAAALTRRVEVDKILLYWMGYEEGSCIPTSLRFLPVAIPVGSHTLHAVGLAMAISYRRGQDAVLCFFGDGATSEGDFHEAMTFAGVRKAPVIFFCQNNAWAISVPRKAQCAASSLAAKAVGYGMAGIQIDGNDPFAAYLATAAALERARAGEGPTLIEAVTYRLGPHTTSDDPDRYRSAEEVEKMRRLEPLPRYRRFLEGRGLWSEEWEKELTAEIETWIAEAVRRVENQPAPGPEEMFDHMFAELPPHLARQKADLLAGLKEAKDG